MTTRITKVFRSVCFVSRRNNPRAPHRYAVELIARGHGTEMYRSKTCDTEDQAQALCDRYLERTPHVTDTTEARR